MNPLRILFRLLIRVLGPKAHQFAVICFDVNIYCYHRNEGMIHLEIN